VPALMMAIKFITLASSYFFIEACEPMNDTNELPSDHFWDAEEAEQEYHNVVLGLAEAQERLKRAQARLLTVDTVANRFAGTPGAVSVLRPSLNIFNTNPLYRDKAIKRDLAALNHAFNPYWLPSEGRLDYDQSLVPWRGCLILRNVESETVQDTVYFGREKKRSGAYVQLRLRYSYEKRVEWYTPEGEIGMSGIEKALQRARGELKTPNALSDKLILELIEEVHAFTAPLGRQVVLTFHPDLAPTNIEEIHLSGGIYKEDVPELAWPPLKTFERPHVGARYGLASYKDIEWPRYGRWEPYQFSPEQLAACRERIEQIDQRLRGQVVAEVREVVGIEEEIRLLRKRQEKIRILHYKPRSYKAFWSAMQATGQENVH
jgi:hypothetical protein